MLNNPLTKVHYLDSRVYNRFPFITKRLYSPVVISLEELALQLFHSNKVITSSVLNSILKYNNICVTDEKLKALLEIKPVEFSFPIFEYDKTKFDSLVGKSIYGDFKGVYVFTHNDRYVPKT